MTETRTLSDRTRLHIAGDRELAAQALELARAGVDLDARIAAAALEAPAAAPAVIAGSALGFVR